MLAIRGSFYFHTVSYSGSLHGFKYLDCKTSKMYIGGAILLRSTGTVDKENTKFFQSNVASRLSSRAYSNRDFPKRSTDIPDYAHKLPPTPDTNPLYLLLHMFDPIPCHADTTSIRSNNSMPNLQPLLILPAVQKFCHVAGRLRCGGSLFGVSLLRRNRGKIPTEFG
jgi:hypothetical protein